MILCKDDVYESRIEGEDIRGRQYVRWMRAIVDEYWRERVDRREIKCAGTGKTTAQHITSEI